MVKLISIVLLFALFVLLSLFVPVEASENDMNMRERAHVTAVAMDNDELAFEFINSEPNIGDIAIEYSCEYDELIWAGVGNLINEIKVEDLDPRDYCQSIEDAINER